MQSEVKKIRFALKKLELVKLMKTRNSVIACYDTDEMSQESSQSMRRSKPKKCGPNLQICNELIEFLQEMIDDQMTNVTYAQC